MSLNTSSHTEGWRHYTECTKLCRHDDLPESALNTQKTSWESQQTTLYIISQIFRGVKDTVSETLWEEVEEQPERPFYATT